MNTARMILFVLIIFFQKTYTSSHSDGLLARAEREFWSNQLSENINIPQSGNKSYR